MIAEILKTKGYKVAVAADGASARARCRRIAELVILDLMLRKVECFELLAEWRADRAPPTSPFSSYQQGTTSRKEYLQEHAELVFQKQQACRKPLRSKFSGRSANHR